MANYSALKLALDLEFVHFFSITTHLQIGTRYTANASETLVNIGPACLLLIEHKAIAYWGSLSAPRSCKQHPRNIARTRPLLFGRLGLLSSILTVLGTLGMLSAPGTHLFGQSTNSPQCGLEQRLGPWRTVCHKPLQFSTSVPAFPRTSKTRMSPAVTLSLFGRSNYPSDRDNGGVWSGRGLSFQIAGGFGGSLGPIRYGFFPALRWSQNREVAVADTSLADYSPYAYPWEATTIDWPQRMGSTPLMGASIGQSYIELTSFWDAAVGISSENIWWGTSRRYPMLLGATSEGFPHLYIRSPTVGLGPLRFIARAVSGKLTESEYFDQNPDNNSNVLSTLRLEIGLKGLPGAQVALTSMVRQRWYSGLSINDLLEQLVPTSTSQGGEMDKVADAVGAITLMLPVTSIGVQLYGTWGRDDFFLDAEDLLTEPDHSQFWSVGLHREWKHSKDASRWSFDVEHASSIASTPQLGTVRGPNAMGSKTIYRHTGSKQGHTQRGQLLGPSIGPGTLATYVALERALSSSYTGMLVERILWDQDTYKRDVLNGSPEGEDREWLFAGRFGTNLDIAGIEKIQLEAFGGLSLRWNRQYIRFTGDLQEQPERESNLWLDLRLAWTPWAER